MGAVNYFTSDYITMGLRPYDPWELENDSDFMEEMRRVGVPGTTIITALLKRLKRQ